MEESADYEFWLDGDIVAIRDLGGPISVSMDAENVLQRISEQIGDLTNRYVLWSDSEGVWDAWIYLNDVLSVYPLSTTDYETARRKLQTYASVEGPRLYLRKSA